MGGGGDDSAVGSCYRCKGAIVVTMNNLLDWTVDEHVGSEREAVVCGGEFVDVVREVGGGAIGEGEALLVPMVSDIDGGGFG
ncbi:hypothetical protein F0562_013972 [Nyssa sinensis]|uniref:Uncharacterized protein n=1 Tax=Nyssa sinensis TaxID=561372 RepID=A0A5J4ZPP3_9ASTE|nr:hypothetical protein F0562_013972 [Nyssa sinensis]